MALWTNFLTVGRCTFPDRTPRILLEMDFDCEVPKFGARIASKFLRAEGNARISFIPEKVEGADGGSLMSPGGGR